MSGNQTWQWQFHHVHGNVFPSQDLHSSWNSQPCFSGVAIYGQESCMDCSLYLDKITPLYHYITTTVIFYTYTNILYILYYIYVILYIYHNICIIVLSYIHIYMSTSPMTINMHFYCMVTSPLCFGWVPLIPGIEESALLAEQERHQREDPPREHSWLVVWNINFIFPINIRNVIIPIDFHIFQRVQTNHQPDVVSLGPQDVPQHLAVGPSIVLDG